MSWNAWLIFPIAGTTLVSYGAALVIERTQRQALRRILLITTLIICLGTLFFFKYFNFMLQSVIDFLNLFSMNLDGIVFDILLPVGISFYTFQTLSYVIDVYRGKFKAERHVGYYALYVSYFPQLVAGPIERPENLLPQLKEKHKFNKEDLSAGLRIMLMGYFRKCVVADVCAVFVNSAFANIEGANALSIFAAGLLFVVQVYNDFAGYSEIATGAARIMGIKLMRNFDRPLSSRSMREFAARWHISLSLWLRDYVYIPLGGGKKGSLRRFRNVMLVFLFCGMWHGANWTFAAWGLYVGLCVCLENILRKPYHNMCKRLGIDNSSAVVVLIRRVILVSLVAAGGLIFRSQSLAEAGLVLTTFFTSFGFGETYFSAAAASLSMNMLDVLQLALTLAVMAMIYKMGEFGREKPIRLSGDIKRENAMWVIRISSYIYILFAIALAWLILLSGSGSSAFVYFQF